jgi:signal transduction histidine kinase
MVLAAVIYFYAVYYKVVFPIESMQLACLIAGTVMLTTIPVNRLLKNPVLTSNYMIAVGVALIAYSTATIGGKESTGVLYLSIAPLIAGFTQTRYVLFWSLVAIALYFGIQYADINSIINPLRLPADIKRKIDLTNSIGITVIISLVTIIFVRDRKYQIEAINQKHTQIKSLLRVIAHDIANPLNLISFAVGRASKKGLDEELQRKIKRGISSISATIKQTHTLQALESGKIALSISEGVSLCEQIQQSIEVFEEQLQKKGIQINLKIDNPELKINVDPLIFQTQVINNILSNAIKFSRINGSIEIQQSQDQPVNSHQIEISIADHGIGIPNDTLPKLFDLQTNNSQPGTAGETGTGFGLPIVKKYIELMHGKIAIQSKPEALFGTESGTTVHLTLPKAS